MIARRAFLRTLAGSLLAAPVAAEAQQPAKVARIGFLGPETVSGSKSRVDALRAGLRDLGYVEGKNIVIEFRWAEGKYDRLPDLATELVRLNVDVLVAAGEKAVDAAKRATTTTPIVVPVTGDAVATSLATSLARPGGNITGSTFFGAELTSKRLELLREAAPRITRVAYLLNPANSASGPGIAALEIAAKSLKLGIQPFEVRAPNEFDSVFTTMAKRHVDAIVVQADTIFIINAKAVADLAATRQFPSAGLKEFAEAGGLIGYGPNLLEMYRHAAVFVDKILKGAKPGDLPIERATTFELVINMKTAKTLGLKIPPSVLLRADQVIQ